MIFNMSSKDHFLICVNFENCKLFGNLTFIVAIWLLLISHFSRFIHIRWMIMNWFEYNVYQIFFSFFFRTYIIWIESFSWLTIRLKIIFLVFLRNSMLNNVNKVKFKWLFAFYIKVFHLIQYWFSCWLTPIKWISELFW